MRLLAMLSIVLFLVGCGSREESTATGGREPALARALIAGGTVLVLRHGKTDTVVNRQEIVGDCATQRNLTVEGREEVRRLGRDVRALGIRVGDVLSSPLCRALDTARLAFGRAKVTMDLVSPGVVGTARGDARRIEKLKALANTPPRAGRTTVMVTHTGNIGGAFGEESVAEGEALVLRPDPSAGAAKLLGSVKLEDWAKLRAALGG